MKALVKNFLTNSSFVTFLVGFVKPLILILIRIVIFVVLCCVFKLPIGSSLVASVVLTTIKFED